MLVKWKMNKNCWKIDKNSGWWVIKSAISYYCTKIQCFALINRTILYEELYMKTKKSLFFTIIIFSVITLLTLSIVGCELSENNQASEKEEKATATPRV